MFSIIRVLILSFLLLALSTAALSTPALEARLELPASIVKDLRGMEYICQNYSNFLPTVNEYDYVIYYSTDGATAVHSPLDLAQNMTAALQKLRGEIPIVVPAAAKEIVQAYSDFTNSLGPFMQALDNQFALFILFGDYENVGNNLATLLPAFDSYSNKLATVLPTKKQQFNASRQVGETALKGANCTFHQDPSNEDAIFLGQDGCGVTIGCGSSSVPCGY